MKAERHTLLTRLESKPASPALRQIKQMVESNHTETDSTAPLQPAREVLSVWSIRLWNATLRGRRFVGLADFVRALMKLDPDSKIEQISIRDGSKVGVLFFSAETKRPIGAVISIHTAVDAKRSRQNLATANGIPFPFVTAPSLAKSR